MRRGFLYLVAIMDWASRKVLAWRLSNSLDASFCIEALEEALGCFGPPRIFNTDQGGQFTSFGFTQVLKDAGVKISMDGKGRWTGIGRWVDLYNQDRPHSSLSDHTPDEVYFGLGPFYRAGLRPVSGKDQTAA